MRRFSPGVAILLLGPGIAHAEQWQARPALLADRSPGGCIAVASGSVMDRGYYTFDLTGDTFSGSAPTGKLFTTKVAGDGSVNHEYKSPSGARLVISGNAKTRKLELKNLNSFCVWEVLPIAN